MKEELFIKTNSNTWNCLENLSTIINKKGISSLKSKEIKEFLHSYRQASHHLAYARTHYPKSTTVTYLNSLIGKCHSHVYTVKKSSFREAINSFFYAFPDALKNLRGYVIFSFAVFFFGFLLSLIMVLYDDGTASYFLPTSLIRGVSNGQLGGGSQWDYPLMSSQIMTNNISVAIKAFVYGISFGIGTIYILFINGALLGALTALVYLYADPVRYWSLILPHGVIELTAIFIAGAAGIIIAKSLLLPEEYSRRHALIDGGKKSIPLLIGVAIMLVIAGIIEGFITPLEIIDEDLKLIIAAFTGILLMLYFSVPYLTKK
ncbi:MAG: stage II sporulation protein M [Epulopiscium sp.]|nr:stage II sporulation protein M [Candidatus Epulonipiscium sp.]